MENSLGVSTNPHARRSKKRLFIGLGLALLLVLGLWTYFYFVSRTAERRLQATVTELDQAEPGWRLDELEASRSKVPDEANSALKVLAIGKSMPANWPGADMSRRLENLIPPHALHPDQAQVLSAEMDKVKSALEDARALKDFPDGRFPIVLNPNWIATSLPHVQEVPTVASLLAYDALARALRNDLDGAVQSCHAGINVARSIGDELFLISQLVRIACRGMALARLEYVLGQGQASAKVLEDLQRLLEKEEAEPIFLFAVRGERAGAHQLMVTLKEGKVTVGQLVGTPVPLGNIQIGPFKLGEFLLSLKMGPVADQHNALLKYMTEAVAIARKPLEDQNALFEQLEASSPNCEVLVQLLVPALRKISEADRRSAAHLRCAIVMLAAERYRLAHQRWPKSLDQMVPDFLTKIPLDPFDKKLLRLKHLADGIMIYAVGPDGKDDGGKLDRSSPAAPGTDIGYRLWDPRDRRQKPLEPPKETTPDPGEEQRDK